MNWNDDKSVCVRFVVWTFKCICTKSNSKTEANTNENVKEQMHIDAISFGNVLHLAFKCFNIIIHRFSWIPSRSRCSLFKMLDLLNFWCFSIWSWYFGVQSLANSKFFDGIRYSMWQFYAILMAYEWLDFFLNIHTRNGCKLSTNIWRLIIPMDRGGCSHMNKYLIG